MAYGKMHQMFVQYIMQECILSEEDAKAFIIRIFSHTDVHLVIATINRELQTIEMAIKRVVCEITGEPYLAFTSTVLDEMKSQAAFKKEQLELLRIILSEIITNGEGRIPSTDCLNLCSTLDIKVSKADAEEFLNVMVAKKWLYLKDGCYYIGVRSIAELMPYFKVTYSNDTLNACPFCKQTIFYGKKCMHCPSIIHLHCMKNYEAIQKPLKCPCCNKAMLTSLRIDAESSSDE